MMLRKYSHYKISYIVELIVAEVAEKGSSLHWWGTPDWEQRNLAKLAKKLAPFGIVELEGGFGWVKQG